VRGITKPRRTVVGRETMYMMCETMRIAHVMDVYVWVYVDDDRVDDVVVVGIVKSRNKKKQGRIDVMWIRWRMNQGR
jgi:hypothetical protein